MPLPKLHKHSSSYLNMSDRSSNTRNLPHIRDILGGMSWLTIFSYRHSFELKTHVAELYSTTPGHRESQSSATRLPLSDPRYSGGVSSETQCLND